jgi:hypothetical protein
VKFKSAYQKLTPAERSYVDNYVKAVDNMAIAQGRSFADALALAPTDDPMLVRPLIEAAIYEQTTEVIKSRQVSPERVLQEIHAISFANLGSYLSICEVTGEPIFDAAKWSPQQHAAIKEFEVTIGHEKKTIKIKLHDKLRGLEMLVRLIETLETNGFIKSQLREAILQIPNNVTAEVAAEIYAKTLEQV